MSKYAKIALFVALGLALVLTPHASNAYYAPTPTANKFSTTVTTGKASYGAGETIVLSGVVKPYENGRDLQIIIRDSANNIAAMETASVNPDGTYSFSISDTAKWKKDNYKVAAQYGYDDVDVGTASFSFDPAGKAAVEKADIKADTKTPVKKTVEKKVIKKAEPKKVVKKAVKAVVKETKKAKTTVKAKTTSK